jgi:hypothetical protein
MEIRFLKKENDRHVITCTRKDGTSTWMNLDSFFLRHDLLHYAVETTMQFKSAFYGMIANGISITDFELPKEQRNIEFSEEALLAEHIVNLIMVESREGKFDDFDTKLRESLNQNKYFLNVALLTGEQPELIHAKYDLLIQQWNSLRTGENITLHFEE